MCASVALGSLPCTPAVSQTIAGSFARGRARVWRMRRIRRPIAARPATCAGEDTHATGSSLPSYERPAVSTCTASLAPSTARM